MTVDSDDINALQSPGQNLTGAVFDSTYEAHDATGWSCTVDAMGVVREVHWSADYCALFGEKLEDSPAGLERFWSCVHPEDLEATEAAFAGALKETTCCTVYDVEYRMKCADGQYYWCRDIGRFIDPAVAPLRRFYGVVILVDRVRRMQALYEKREAELAELCKRQAEQLEEIQRLNEQLAASNRDMARRLGTIKALGRQYATIWYNSPSKNRLRLIQNTGFRVHEASVRKALVTGTYEEGQQLYADLAVHEEDREAYLVASKVDVVVRETQRRPVYRVPFRRCSEYGTEYYEECFARTDATGASDDFVVGYKNVDKEVREEKKKQEALETALDAAQRASRAKTVFLNNISHDIRTPMNGIIGMTAIASAHLNDARRVKDCLAKISVASSHLLGLINDVLDISRIESGKATLNEEKFSLAGLFSDLITTIDAAVEAKGLDLAIDVHGVVHENVLGDAIRLRQVFLNILTNAVNFTPRGGRIEVMLAERPTTSRHYASFEFVCRDTGCGMTPEFLKRLFTPFERAEDAFMNHTPGTGLGLPIARNIVRMMDGDITVASEYGKGSTFSVTFRLKAQTAPKPSDEILKGLSVLVVDDDEILCESTCYSLSELGMKGDYVLSGEAAVVKVKEAHEAALDYNVCLIDWRMPGMDGVQTTRAVRECVGPDVPIIIISAYDWTTIEKEAREAGADGFIEKPLFKSRLDAVISGLITGKQEEAENEAMVDDEHFDFTGRRILLVEDNPLNQEIGVEVLGMTKAMVETAENGREAVAAYEGHEAGYYDVILMDIQMPELDGNAAAQLIRAAGKADSHTVPIIAMSANAYAEDREKARAAGMNDYLTKPVNFKTMLTLIRRHLEEKFA